jgi:putative transposase
MPEGGDAKVLEVLVGQIVKENGYRRIHLLLRRKGWRINPKRVYRLCGELGLQLHKTRLT